MENDLPEMTEEFFTENKNHFQKINLQKKKGGPFSKHQRDKRRDEVYRLHFEYGYSARKIADLKKVNRNTVNGDIEYWYSKIIQKRDIFDSVCTVTIGLQRLEIQRSRLREQLDRAKTFQEKLALERLILEIDYKILYTHDKLTNSAHNLVNHGTDELNRWLKENKKDLRYLTYSDKIPVSDKSYEKINQIIKQDRSHSRNVQ